MKMTKAENGVDIEFMNENSNLEFRGPPQAEIFLGSKSVLKRKTHQDYFWRGGARVHYYSRYK